MAVGNQHRIEEPALHTQHPWVHNSRGYHSHPREEWCLFGGMQCNGLAYNNYFELLSQFFLICSKIISNTTLIFPSKHFHKIDEGHD